MSIIVRPVDVSFNVQLLQASQFPREVLASALYPLKFLPMIRQLLESLPPVIRQRHALHQLGHLLINCGRLDEPAASPAIFGTPPCRTVVVLAVAAPSRSPTAGLCH